jgi:hypothetical protein
VSVKCSFIVANERRGVMHQPNQIVRKTAQFRESEAGENSFLFLTAMG